MNNSSALEEFIASRCDEILACNDEYQRLNLAILEAEKKVKAKFTDDLNDFLKYEQLVIEQLIISNVLIYKAIIGA